MKDYIKLSDLKEYVNLYEFVPESIYVKWFITDFIKWVKDNADS